MKIACHCGNIVTKDLYVTKHQSLIKTFEDEDSYAQYEVKPGVIIPPKRGSKKIVLYAIFDQTLTDRLYSINKTDLISATYPEFKTGMGCCDVSHQIVRCDSCHTEIGLANLDCWQTRRIDLFESKTHKVYRDIK